MREEIENVLEAMREDYRRWSDRCASHKETAHFRIKEEMEENYWYEWWWFSSVC